ncbi:MAG: hypothetical protein WDM80_04930 [Limisphaerales bacterium]
MEVILFGRGSESLLADFDSAGIAYERWIPRPWQILDAGFWARIADGVSWPDLAAVMVAWVQTGGFRKISLTQIDNKIINIAGISAGEVATMLPSCKNIMAVERQKTDTKSGT